MRITEKDVIYVADLASLELTEQERLRMIKDLDSILTYIDRLNELDTANVPPMAQVSTITNTPWREDTLTTIIAAQRCPGQCARDGWRFLQSPESD